VTCGATSGPSTTMNLMQLFQQQYKIFGSFGFTIKNIVTSLDKIAKGIRPVIDSEIDVADFGKGLKRLEGRRVFGKIVVRF
jgi:alcohol dehydrogenase